MIIQDEYRTGLLDYLGQAWTWLSGDSPEAEADEASVVFVHSTRNATVAASSWEVALTYASSTDAIE